ERPGGEQVGPPVPGQQEEGAVQEGDGGPRRVGLEEARGRRQRQVAVRGPVGDLEARRRCDRLRLPGRQLDARYALLAVVEGGEGGGAGEEHRGEEGQERQGPDPLPPRGL